MKQAKFALTAVAILAIIGGALAFKANRVNRTFYVFTETLDANNHLTGACIVQVGLKYAPNAAGTIVLTSVASGQSVGAVTCTARVVPSL